MKHTTVDSSELIYLPGSGGDDARVAFALKLGRALHRYGTPAHRLEQTMNMILNQLGLEGRFFSMPTGVFASFGAPEEYKTSLIRTEVAEVNLERLTLLDELAERVIRGDLALESGTRQIDEIVAAPPRYSPVLAIFCYSLASATSARFFGGGWREMAVAAAIGVVIGSVAVPLTRAENTRRVFEIIAAVIASALATLAALYLAPFSIYVATLASLIVLIPGLTLTTAMTELATGNLVSGSARMTGAVMTFTGIAFGVALGAQTGRLIPLLSVAGIPEPLSDWTIWLCLCASPFAFTVLMKARPRDLGWITLASFLSFGGARLGTSLLGPELGAFLGAATLALGANLVARFQIRPAALLLLPGLILLVPGSIGFDSLTKFMEQDVVSGVEGAFRVVVVAVAIVTGLLMANVILPPKRE